ncbi:hypothetical protein SLS60_001418 [Paraconiothyrium brasiliense]|uniref:F-box domain-containing protein n=1 Tax=Paraconiothyrium brasiliense TaxID=300254 RepID=A0ABR3S923_9PLEO
MAELSRKLEDCPKEVLVQIAYQASSARDAVALMQTCRAFYELLAGELLKDLPVTQLRTLNVDTIKRYGTKTKNLILHHSHGDPDLPMKCLLEETLRDLLEIFHDSESLEVFGFTNASSIPNEFYAQIVKLLKSEISLRLLVLPENVKKDWQNDTESLFGAHVRVRRGGPEQTTQGFYSGAQRVREHPTTKGEGRGRKYFDIYFHNACDLGTIKAALTQPGSTVEEANIFGPRAMTSEAAVEDWQVMCDRMGLKTEDLNELGLHECLLGPVSPLANLKLSEKLGALSIVNSVSSWSMLDTIEAGLPEEMDSFSTNTLLAKLREMHANDPSTGMYKFIYRQNLRNGTAEAPNDPLSNETLKSFIKHSPRWRVLCIQHNLTYDGSMADFARPTLEYAAFRFANQQFRATEVKQFADGSRNLLWLGLYINAFTRVLEEHKLPTTFEQDIEHIARSMRTMRKLRVLCVYAQPDQNGSWLKHNPLIDRAITALARQCVKKNLPLDYIHLVVRRVDYDESRWHKIPAAITYIINRSVPVFKSGHKDVSAVRIDTLPESVNEDLETMGGGKRRTMRHILRDTMDHLHVTPEDMQKRDAARARREAKRVKKRQFDQAKEARESSDRTGLEAPLEEEEGGVTEHDEQGLGSKRKASPALPDESPSSPKAPKLVDSAEE